MCDSVVALFILIKFLSFLGQQFSQNTHKIPSSDSAFFKSESQGAERTPAPVESLTPFNFDFESSIRAVCCYMGAIPRLIKSGKTLNKGDMP
jgi:hypothetical protein